MSIAALLFTIAAVLAIVAVRPDRHRHERQQPDGHRGIVTADDEVARSRVLLCGVVADDHPQAGARVQIGRERIVDQFPVRVLVPEGDAGDVQLAVACVADGNRGLDSAAGFDPTEQPEPVTLILPAGTSPLTKITCGPDGSLLEIVSVAVFAPRLVG